MEQQHKTLKEHLTFMGFSDADAELAVTAGIKDVNQAVDYIHSEAAKLAPENTDINFPSLSGAQVTSSATSSQPAYGTGTGTGPGPEIRGLTNARDSLDRIHVNRISGSDAPAPGQAEGDVRMSQDDELQRVMELSRKEADRRDIAQAVELSKQEEEAARPVVQDEDPDVIRAIEESLKDSPRLGAPDRAVTWRSQGFADVKERMRTSLDEPVGLRNIGNTCYLNSLLQVYYHLSDFRRAIMAFRPPEEHMHVSVQQDSLPPVQVPNQQPVVETPDDGLDGGNDNENPHDRLERTIAASQMDQSFDRGLNGDDLSKLPEGTSGMSFNHVEAPEDNSAVSNAVQFVVELQKLFAGMALGNQNCADPTGVAHTMRDPNGHPIVIGAQQDAYEFNHLFLDIVERGLRSEAPDNQSVQGEKSDIPDAREAASPAVAMEDSNVAENIVKDMFTVRFRQELRTCPSDRSCPGDDRECPVTISQGETSEIVVNATSKDYRNLHSGLDDYAFAQIEYESSQSIPDATNAPSALETGIGPPLKVTDSMNSRTSPTTFKSVWFTRMPPVVVIYLQRATYNKETSQAEKVHARYDFPCEISFDRYLEENKDASIRAREVVQRIRSEREQFLALLKRYKTFPHSEPPKDQSVQNNGIVDMDVSESGLPESRRLDPVSQLTTAEDSSKQPGSQYPGENCESIFDAATRVEARLLESVNASSPLFALEGLSRERVEASIEVLNTVIEYDWKQCESFAAKVRSLDQQEESAYQGVDKAKYRLHAVLVHDGAPSGGHYWTFIRNWNAAPEDLKWMRLSDSSVINVTEEDMLSWSVGGKSRASAYCLIYAVESTLESKYRTGESISEESRRLLPAVRIEEVQRASSDFTREVQEQALPAK